MNDVLRKNLPLEADILKIIFSSSKIDLNTKYGGSLVGEYPLLLAAIFLDKYEIWEVLINNDKVNWKYVDDKGRNIGFWSVCCRTKNIFKFLKTCQMKNIDFDKRDIIGNRAISVAVQHRKLDIVKFLVEECKVDINAQNDTGITIGHDVCERSYDEILEYLLSKGLKLNIENDNKETAINYARMYYSQSIMDILIKHNLWNNEHC